MNLVVNIKQLNLEHVFLQEPIKNTVMDNSDFIRIIYSTESFMINGLYIKISLHTSSIEKYFNKYKCIFDIATNRNIINELIAIEKCILLLVNNNKVAQYRIKDQLMAGFIKMFISHDHNPNNQDFIVKISGIWETKLKIGLTYKIMEL